MPRLPTSSAGLATLRPDRPPKGGISSPARSIWTTVRTGPDTALRCALVALLALSVFLLLFTLREFDDNRLTSWQWVFADADVTSLGVNLMAALAMAYLFTFVYDTVFDRPWLLFIFAFGAASLFWPIPEVIVDSARYFAQAKHLELYGVGFFVSQWGQQIAVWTDLPLVPALFGVAMSWLGESRLAIQLVTTVAFALTAVLTYQIGRHLWNREIGLTAGMLLLAMPYLLTQVPLTMVDVPSMCFLTLAVLVSLKALEHGGTWWIATAALSIGLAMLTKYSTWLMLSVVPVIGLVQAHRLGSRVAVRLLALAGWLALFLAPVLLWRRQLLVDQLGLLHAYQLPGLYRWGESFVSTFLFQLHPFVTALALAGIVVAMVRKDPKFLIAAWMVALILVLEIKRIRYTVIVFPMLALMAAYGLSGIRDQFVRRFTVLAAVASSLVIAGVGYSSFLNNTSSANLARAGAYLSGLDQSRIEVLTLPQRYSIINPAVSVPILDLYTRQPIHYQRMENPAEYEPPSQIETSALRFTWEVPVPAFLSGNDASAAQVVVVIHSDPAQPVPEALADRLADYQLIQEFRKLSGVFRYRTMVRIYQPKPNAQREFDT